MPTGDFALIKEGIVRCVSKRREIQTAYIFGSVASGRARPGSDVAVAVMLGQKSQRLGVIEYRSKLAAEISSAIRRSDVDLVILNESPPVLAHQVLSTRQLL